MKKRFFSIFIILFALIFSFNPSQVSAKEILKRGESTNIDKQVIGAITFYDDYTISFEYSVMLRNPTVKVCPLNSCNTVLAQINTQQVYLNKETLTFSLSEYINEYDDSDVLVVASGEYKVNTTDLGFPSVVEIKYTIEKVDDDSQDSDQKELNEHVEKVQKVFNTWVFPGIYILLAVVFVIKLILLSIDLVKFSDQPDVRREKIKGFVYVFLGLLAVSAVNASAGFLTGLYN